MARITTSQAVADRNSRLASELAAIGGVPAGTGWRIVGRHDPTKGPVSGRPSSPRGIKGRQQASAASRGRRGQQIAEPADGLDDVDVELLADAADEHLDRVGVAVKVLVVEMLDEFGAGHDAA